MTRIATVAISVALLAVWGSAPASAAAPSTPRGFYGVTWDREVVEAAPQLQERQWATMTSSGVETVRTVFSWYLAQERPGASPSFERTDRAVELASAEGIRLLPVVAYAPPWARVQPAELASSPRGTAGYTAYLGALVARYGPSGSFWREHPELPRRPLREWQIWNEPHMPYQWLPHEGWASRYGKLVRAADRTLAKADPGARLVLAGLTNDSWRHLDELYRRGGVAGRFDAATFHVYTRVAANLVEILRRDRRVLDRRGDSGVPIYLTEFGASASAGRVNSPEQRHLQTTDRGLASRLGSYYGLLARNARALRLRRAYWYTWASSYAPGTGVFDFAGLVRYDGVAARPKPSLAAYRASARRHRAAAR